MEAALYDISGKKIMRRPLQHVASWQAALLQALWTDRRD